MAIEPDPIVAAAERDIKSRQDFELRRNKLIWRLLSLNALGALSYSAGAGSDSLV